MLDRIRGRKPLPKLGVVGDAKGLAEHVLDAPVVRAHLEGTRHFGILKRPVDIDITRLGYVELQCSLLLRLKERYPGYGLGSKVAIDGGEATGLELCQLWAVLGSWGHLWGTFATERALAFNAFHGGLGETLLTLVPERNRVACRAGSLHLSMYRLHECIASMLLARDVPGVVDADRSFASSAWTIYISHDRRFTTLLRAFRFARIGDSTARVVLLLGVARVLSNDNREVTELDGLALIASASAMTIVVAECKHAARPRLAAQTQRFADLFVGKVEEMATTKVNGATTSIWTHRFP